MPPQTHHAHGATKYAAAADASSTSVMNASIRLRNLYFRALIAAAFVGSYRRRRAAINESATRRSLSSGASRPEESSTYSYSSARGLPVLFFVFVGRDFVHRGVDALFGILEIQCQLACFLVGVFVGV